MFNLKCTTSTPNPIAATTCPLELLYLYGFVIDNNPDDYVMVHYPLEAIQSVPFSKFKVQLLEAQILAHVCGIPVSSSSVAYPNRLFLEPASGQYHIPLPSNGPLKLKQYKVDRMNKLGGKADNLANGIREHRNKKFGQPSREEEKRRSSISRKSVNLDHIMVPETVFALSEKPICSFQVHLDDVLDLSWSKSQHLLSSSMDKTVRLWHLFGKSCLKVFSHSDYVADKFSIKSLHQEAHQKCTLHLQIHGYRSLMVLIWFTSLKDVAVANSNPSRRFKLRERNLVLTLFIQMQLSPFHVHNKLSQFLLKLNT